MGPSVQPNLRVSVAGPVLGKVVELKHVAHQKHQKADPQVRQENAFANLREELNRSTLPPVINSMTGLVIGIAKLVDETISKATLQTQPAQVSNFKELTLPGLT